MGEIQAVLDSSAVGDTISFQPGRYSLLRGLFIRHTVFLKSLSGPEGTILDLEYNIGSVITIDGIAPAPSVVGLTITRGVNVSDLAGGGILIRDCSPLIADNLIVANSASNFEGKDGWGGGIAVFDGSPTIRNNTIVGNSAAFGGVYLEGTDATVTNNIIAYNSNSTTFTNDGYGLVCLNASSAYVRDNIFWANLAGNIGSSCPSVVSDSSNVTLDPILCDPRYVNLAYQGDWHLRTDSPAAPGHPYFGWGAQLSFCPGVAVESTSWGRIKARYR